MKAEDEKLFREARKDRDTIPSADTLCRHTEEVQAAKAEYHARKQELTTLNTQASEVRGAYHALNAQLAAVNAHISEVRNTYQGIITQLGALKFAETMLLDDYKEALFAKRQREWNEMIEREKQAAKKLRSNEGSVTEQIRKRDIEDAELRAKWAAQTERGPSRGFDPTESKQ